jgi:hypothetical protein
MLRNRLLVALGVCFLAASGAWADEVGFVDCSKSAEATQVFGKPRKSQDVVASLPCGERFTILVYGFYFSRIQTKDGQVGYVYSSLISQDRGATSLQPAATTPQTGQQAPVLQAAAEKTKIPRSTPFDAQPNVAAPQPQPATAQVATQQAAAAPATSVQAATTQPPAVEVASAAPTSASSTISSNGTATTANASQQGSSAVVEAQPTPAQPTASQTSAVRPAATSVPVFTTPPAAPPTPNADAPETTVAVEQASSDAAAVQPAADQPEAQPAPAAAAPAEPAPAQPAPAKPAAPAIRPADLKESWEKPRPSVRAAPLLELYGGFAFARMGGTGFGSNSIGGLGSVGWNARSWLQILADTSYNVETVDGAKNVLYGNHYGPRFFYRARNRWGITPFAEALVGGSNFKTTVSGSAGYTSSTGATLSYKVGGGVDIHPSHRWEIRLIDVDYYKTAFGTDTHQTNYWISTGVVLRLFGGGSE